MKLNYDCLRQLLIVLEENLQFSDDLEFPELSFQEVCNIMVNYNKADIAYSTIMANEAGLINADLNDDIDVNIFCGCRYYRITYNGHEFLENIKDRNVWDTTKSILAKAGSISLEFITKVSSSVIQGIIEKQLHP